MNPGTPVSFDSNSLQTLNIFTNDIQHENMGTKLAIPYIIAHANGSVIPFTEYSSKMVTLQGTVKGTSVADLDARLDAFRGFFINSGRNLDIGYSGGTRRYIATCLTCDIQRPGGLAYATFTVTFMCLQAFGQDTSATTPVNVTGLTVAARTDAVTFNGSAPQQLCVVTITLHTITSTGNQSINWGNNNNGQQITVNRAWLSNDILQIDCVNRVVTVNGFGVDYTGAFPEFPPGAQSLGYSDSLTTRNFDYNVAYNARWL